MATASKSREDNAMNENPMPFDDTKQSDFLSAINAEVDKVHLDEDV